MILFEAERMSLQRLQGGDFGDATLTVAASRAARVKRDIS
jgi:hypothetical protein